MSHPIRVGVQIQPGNAPDYASWRAAVRYADDIGADYIFGYDHFHQPVINDLIGGQPVLADLQPDVTNFEDGPPWPAGARSPTGPTSACWSPVPATATPICPLTWHAPSTPSAAAASSSDWAPAGTKRITSHTDTISAASRPDSTCSTRASRTPRAVSRN